MLLIIIIPVVLAVQTYSSVEPILSCDPIGHARPLCGWQNPEDMVALPDGHHVIVSEFGDQEGERAGTLSLLDLRTETRRVLYPGEVITGSGSWGSPECEDAPGTEFSPHGIHLSRRADGRLQLLAVQHGLRESVELFEVNTSSGRWGLTWQGCVVAPEGSMLNDVAATPEGGFLVTHMMTKKRGMLAQFAEYMKANILGIDSGYVLAWKPGEGFSRLDGSEGGVPNGIEITPDGETVFVNYSARGEVRRIDRHRGRVEARNTTVPPLDNITWTPEGQLLVAAGLAGAMEMMPCMNIESGSCPGAFAIMSVDPETLESETIYEGGPDTPSGAGTVGLRLNDNSLLVGTFAGDRIVYVTLH